MAGVECEAVSIAIMQAAPFAGSFFFGGLMAKEKRTGRTNAQNGSDQETGQVLLDN